MNRDPQLEMALRRNRGRRLISEWRTRFNAATDFESSAEDFLGLEDTADLKEKFIEVLRSDPSVEKSSIAAHAHEGMFERLKSTGVHEPSRVILFSNVDAYIGGLRVPPDVVLAHAKEVWELVGEDLSMCSEDLVHGFRLELNYYDEAARYVADGVYQMAGWGAFSRLAV